MSVKYFYSLSVVVLVVGFGLFGIHLYKGYLSLNDLLVPVRITGETIIDIDSGNIYSIYYEDSSLDDIGSYLSSFALMVKNSAGNYMPIQRVNEGKKYNYKGRVGRAVYQVNLPRAGRYEFLSFFGGEKHGRNFTLFFDKGFSEKRAQIIVKAQAVLLFPILISLALFLYAYSKR